MGRQSQMECTPAEVLEPGKDHYVRRDGKTIGILLASQYPSEWHLEQAKRAYERGTGGPVKVSSNRSLQEGTIDDGSR